MAKASPKITQVTLELSLEEAQALQALFYNIKGNRVQTARRHIEAIGMSLFEAGVYVPINDALEITSGAVTFHGKGT